MQNHYTASRLMYGLLVSAIIFCGFSFTGLIAAFLIVQPDLYGSHSSAASERRLEEITRLAAVMGAVAGPLLAFACRLIHPFVAGATALLTMAVVMS